MGIEDITNQPGYISLRSTLAEGSTQVALWIGAGLSKDAGIPLWEDLYARL